MKRISLLVLAAFVLSACSQPAEPETLPPAEDAPSVINAQDAGATAIAPEAVSQLGETCGPNTAKVCDSGLHCKFSGQQSDEGICVQNVADETIECSDERAPVCGLIGDNKNGYLNECEAKRHGAVVVSQGFCKPDPNIPGSCDARAYSIGNCQDTFTGAKFDATSKNCEAVTLVGCDADLPFNSVAECQQACSQ